MKSQILFENQNYIVCVVKPGLTCQSKRKSNGKYLPRNSKQFDEFVNAFLTTDDLTEKNTLARVIYES